MKQVVSGWTLLCASVIFAGYGVSHHNHDWTVLGVVCGIVGASVTTWAWRE